MRLKKISASKVGGGPEEIREEDGGGYAVSARLVKTLLIRIKLVSAHAIPFSFPILVDSCLGDARFGVRR